MKFWLFLKNFRLRRSGLKRMRDGLPPKMNGDTGGFDDHLMKWLWVYALVLYAIVHGCEHVHWSTRDAVPLQVTREIRR